MLSNEYGWTTEYILTRTFREIDYRLYAIDRRQKLNLKMKASLNGKKIKDLVIPKRTKKNKEVVESMEDKIINAKVRAAYNKRLELTTIG